MLDSYTDSTWLPLTSHSPELGGPIVKHPAGSASWYIVNGRAICRNFGPVYYSGAPATADYTVEATVRIFTTVTSPADLNLGIAGRMSTSADTYYALYYQAGELVLIKRVNGVTATALDIWTTTLTGGGTNYTFALEMIGTAIKGYVNGVERVSATDSAITAVGRGGLRSNGINDTSTGNHIDNFRVFDATTPPTGQSFAFGLIGLP